MKLGTLGLLTLLGAGCAGQGTADHLEPIDMGPPPIDVDLSFPGPPGPPPEFGPTVSASPAPAPLAGGTLRLLADGKTAVAADPDRDQVYLVDLAGGTLTATLALQAGDEPGRAVQDGAGRVQLLARRGGALITIDPVAATILSRRSVCPAPRGLAYDAAADAVHVACAGGELVTLPAAGGAATRTLQLDRDLRDVAVVGSQLWVTTFKTATLLVVDGNGSVVNRLELPDVADFNGPFAAAVAWRMVPLPDGRLAIAHQQALTGPVEVTQGGYGGGPGGCGSISRAAVSIVDPASASVVSSVAVGQVVLPADLAFDGHGGLALLSAGNGHTPTLPQAVTVPVDVVVTPPPDGGVVDGGAFDAGPPDPPDGDFTPPGGGCVFGSPAFVDGEAIALGVDGGGHLWVQTREPAALVRADDPQIRIPLASDSRADTGWAVFHSNSGANLACASCHPEGGEDGRTWQFDGIGPRRTQSLRGNVGPTAPFHWNGSLPDFAALVGEVYQRRMSGPILAPDQEQALSAWVDTIPLLPHSPPPDPAAVARGQALFDDAINVGCTTCHSGPQLTNNATVDVGTGGMFQVPRLVGVGWRAPFLHDGCAATLADRFGACGGGDQHGLTSKLTASQLADLTAYLDTL